MQYTETLEELLKRFLLTWSDEQLSQSQRNAALEAIYQQVDATLQTAEIALEEDVPV